MDDVREALDREIRRLLDRHDEPVLLEMERLGDERRFPIVGRTVGIVLEILARGIGARRVFELGSGFGYSAYWFSRAVGPSGELHLTDMDPENERLGTDFLTRAGLAGPVAYHVGDALASFAAAAGGEFDIVFCDIDKQDYPRAWRAARERIRPGGLYIADNALGFGAGTIVSQGVEGRAAEMLRAIREHDEEIAADPGFVSTILPIRDGVLVAHRLR